MKKIITAIAVSAVVSINVAHAEGRSAEQIAQQCAACHGPDGNSTNPTFPHLAGQYANYMVKALKDYKSGKRTGPMAGMMVGQVANMTEDEMETIAKFFAAQEGKLAAMPAN